MSYTVWLPFMSLIFSIQPPRSSCILYHWTVEFSTLSLCMYRSLYVWHSSSRSLHAEFPSLSTPHTGYSSLTGVHCIVPTAPLHTHKLCNSTAFWSFCPLMYLQCLNGIILKQWSIIYLSASIVLLLFPIHTLCTSHTKTVLDTHLYTHSFDLSYPSRTSETLFKCHLFMLQDTAEHLLWCWRDETLYDISIHMHIGTPQLAWPKQNP